MARVMIVIVGVSVITASMTIVLTIAGILAVALIIKLRFRLLLLFYSCCFIMFYCHSHVTILLIFILSPKPSSLI